MERVERFLSGKRQDGALRALRPADWRKEGRINAGGKTYHDFSSNDYLGLSCHPGLKEASKLAIEEFGAGACASRLLSGDLNLHHRLEEKTAAFKGKSSALVFNSGYQANVGIIASLYKKGDAIFSDRLNHASIIDGILLSGAKLFRFKHNDQVFLERLLKKERNNFKAALVITESVFSMDGDRFPLKGLADLKRKYSCEIMVDEAHATGIFGQRGSGLVEEEDMTGEVDLIMGTFGKALGGFGAYLACSAGLRDYLVNACRSFIYTTALPPAVIASGMAAIDLVKEEAYRRKTLLKNADFFREALRETGLDIRGRSQIVPWVTGTSERTVRVSGFLQERGYWALPIRPPTVPEGQARIRFSLTYHHSKELLERLVEDIREADKI